MSAKVSFMRSNLIPAVSYLIEQSSSDADPQVETAADADDTSLISFGSSGNMDQNPTRLLIDEDPYSVLESTCTLQQTPSRSTEPLIPKSNDQVPEAEVKHVHKSDQKVRKRIGTVGTVLVSLSLLALGGYEAYQTDKLRDDRLAINTLSSELVRDDQQLASLRANNELLQEENNDYLGRTGIFDFDSHGSRKYKYSVVKVGQERSWSEANKMCRTAVPGASLADPNPLDDAEFNAMANAIFNMGKCMIALNRIQGGYEWKSMNGSPQSVANFWLNKQTPTDPALDCVYIMNNGTNFLTGVSCEGHSPPNRCFLCSVPLV